MAHPTFTFSPDGEKMFLFSPSLGMMRALCLACVALLCCVAFTLLGIAQFAERVFIFFLTASPESLIRVMVMLLVAIGVLVFVRLRTASFVVRPFRAAKEA